MEFSNPGILWHYFAYCVLIAVGVGALLGGILKQERMGGRANNKGIALSMAWVGLLALPFGIWWGSDYLSAIYRLECRDGAIFFWRNMSPKPIRIDFAELGEVRLGLTASRGDLWVLNIYVSGLSHPYSTPAMPNRMARTFIDDINRMKNEGCGR